ncbi:MULTISPECIES: preprotein translocase subunit SecE [Porcipelethomonas]|jgi:preprotein translocase subunit SecE|uniref:preprotein translocase subunit SecE n=1 Tax=Porcipelethomonas TaxID=2981643 RepID=UPI0008216054|nr:preprotein translocase subunit SecE [Porcipelethomonas ammoniilytica]MBS1324599.1 preprotein translocase subunit SecE [Oscillospiraceae bacterium]MBS6314126.1 preprotein translocase subunit SecE [Ruminococcus sp.]OLA72074.1 MAG: preprotein translocase subunit SecE [Ruminococcus sp. 37_24]SCI65775.1 Preprotein translocase subunit SecE [uncultured Ruminococcus sp.]MCU6718937.1 preprotein translocase subunit SecE [Porcipelethomonas ammoniilytica]
MSKESKTKEKKTSDKSKKKKPNRIVKWFKDLKSEFKKVVWPSRKKVFNNTFVVLVVLVIASVFVGGLDFGLLKLFSFVLNLG